MPCGKAGLSRSIAARTLFESASALEPGAWNTPMPTAESLFSSERKE